MKSSLVFSLLFVIAQPGQNVGQAAPVKIYAGGVAGIGDLANPANSQQFRAAGGGLYLHSSGWAALTGAQREQIIAAFHGAPAGLEMGFETGARAQAWAESCRHLYIDLGLRFDFIAANAFANDNHPTAEQWAAYTKAYRAAGVPVGTLVLPTFEYQNFRKNIQTLALNHVSDSAWFQGIVREAGGIVLDTPAGYFLTREQAYRDWVVDAVQWTRRQGLKSVVIISPRTSKMQFAAHAQLYVAYLRNHDAMPDIIVCENYNPKPPSDYPNRVGSESQPNTTLGVAWTLLKSAPH